MDITIDADHESSREQAFHVWMDTCNGCALHYGFGPSIWEAMVDVCSKMKGAS
jgi:hypothetical protein